jgi:hypothetical protein
MIEWSASDVPVRAEFVPAVPERPDPVASLPERERLLYLLRRSVLESSGGVCAAEDCYALADLLEEDGDPRTAFAVRWMGWYGRRPAYRDWRQVRRPWCWHNEQGGMFPSGNDRTLMIEFPHSRLPPLVFRSLTPAKLIRLYDTAEDAVRSLGCGLERLRKQLEPPERKR